MMKEMDDRELLESIKAGGEMANRSFKYFYKNYFPLILHFIKLRGGDENEAKDVFQDAIVALYEQIKEEKFKGQSSVKTYFHSICKYMWYNYLKKRSRNVEWMEKEEPFVKEWDNSPFHLMVETEKQLLLKAVLEQLDEKCRQILLYVIYERFSMKRIASLMGFKDAQNARNKHYKCRNALKELVQNKPDIRNALLEIR